MDIEKKLVSRAAITIGMDDVPWLDKDTIQEVLNSTPPHLRDAVKNGTPSLGSGAIYPIPLDDIVLSQMDAAKLKPLPAHWKYLYGMDVGWNRTAIVVIAQDPDTDVMYVIDEYYGSKQEPAIHASRIKQKCDWMVGVIDPTSKGRTQVDGKQLLQMYRSEGLKLREADNEVEAGIYKVWSRLAMGTLKFFPNVVNLQNEYLLYRRDDNGRIVKEHDHALDALRYAINSWKHAQQKPVIGPLARPTNRKYNV